MQLGTGLPVAFSAAIKSPQLNIVCVALSCCYEKVFFEE